MNWEEIKDRCSKAYELLCGNDEFKRMQYSKLFKGERLLYDFFDENEIAICITPDYYGSMEYHPSKYKDGDYIYYWINVGFKWEDDIEYKTRTEAEQAAFTKAFEILESKLNG